MKKLLLFSVLSLFCLSISAQTKTWIGPSGGDFNVAASWSPVGVPNNINEVIIPTGSAIRIATAQHSVSSISLQGNATLTLENYLTILNPSTIATNASIIWNSGNITGVGSLTNNGTITMLTPTNKALQSTFTLINNGTFNINFFGDFYLGNGTPTLNNTTSGIINLNTSGRISGFNGYGTLINSGIINKVQDAGTYQIMSYFSNEDGTINVENGTLKLDSPPAIINNGSYNVAAGSTLELASSFILSGTLSGLLNGQLLWSGTLQVDPEVEAILDFNGSEPIDWSDGNFKGGGTLTNKGIINLTGSNAKSIQGASTLDNKGTINVNTTGDLRLGNGAPTLNNNATGTINFNNVGQISGFNGTGILVNSGTITKAQNSGLYQVLSDFTNNNGTISVQQGTLKLNTINAILNDGIYNVSNGQTLEWANKVKLLGTLSGALNGQISWTGAIKVDPSTEAILDFSGSEPINWSSGNFNGNGTLTNMGVVNLTGTSSKTIQGTSTFDNEGTINVNSTGDFNLGNGTPTLNNTATGTINFNNVGKISGSNGTGILVNFGTIKKAADSGLYQVTSDFTNNNGTISVEQGTLKLNNLNVVLNDGIYNVSNGQTLEWANTVKLLGTLTGALNGQISWTGTVKVDPSTEAILDFSGPTGINWSSGNFNGNGTLTNMGLINVIGTSGKIVQGTSILKNKGTINVDSSGDLALGNGTPTLMNTVAGIINLNSDSKLTGSNGTGTLVNSGLVIKEESTGTFTISANTNNTNPGRIICENGLITFGNYIGDGTLGGNGSVKLSTTTIFEGIISPGSSPGTLTHIGNYESSANTILSSEIFGPNPSTGYDVFDVQGNAILEGTINLSMEYAANLNDEFVILTANSIVSCNLPTTATARYDNHDYTFAVICNPNNVTLKVTDIVLGKEENKLGNTVLYPNPSTGNFTIDLGTEFTDVTVQIINMLGQTISTSKYPSAKTIEQKINMAAGIYLVKVSTAKDGSNTLRIIKQ